MSLDYKDHREDPGTWASHLGVSVEACELLLDAHFIDLHCDMEVPIRVIWYDPSRHHGESTRTMPFMSHTDYPRIREASISGVVYDIATNPFRPPANRLRTTRSNIRRAIDRVRGHPEEQVFCRNRSDYDAAQAAGKTAYWLSLQGGNALSYDLSSLEQLGPDLHRITLVHLTTSDLGGTNSPAGGDIGTTERGREFIERCNDQRVIVDLAHAGKRTFWEALEAHVDDVPPIVSHTGVEGVHPHWRNVDDAQIRAIADRGGVVGVMYQSNFLAPVWYTCARARIVDHLAHIIALVGEDHAAIGTDYDGMIIPPHDLADVTHHPKLVQDMLDRGWSETRIRKILGENYLRVVGDVRP